MACFFSSIVSLNAQGLTSSEKIKILELDSQSQGVIQTALANDNYTLPEMEQANKLKEKGISDTTIKYVMMQRAKLTDDDINDLLGYQTKNYPVSVIHKTIDEKPKYGDAHPATSQTTPQSNQTTSSSNQQLQNPQINQPILPANPEQLPDRYIISSFGIGYAFSGPNIDFQINGQSQLGGTTVPIGGGVAFPVEFGLKFSKHIGVTLSYTDDILSQASADYLFANVLFDIPVDNLHKFIIRPVAGIGVCSLSNTNNITYTTTVTDNNSQSSTEGDVFSVAHTVTPSLAGNSGIDLAFNFRVDLVYRFSRNFYIFGQLAYMMESSNVSFDAIDNQIWTDTSANNNINGIDDATGYPQVAGQEVLSMSSLHLSVGLSWWP